MSLIFPSGVIALEGNKWQLIMNRLGADNSFTSNTLLNYFTEFIENKQHSIAAICRAKVAAALTILSPPATSNFAPR